MATLSSARRQCSAHNRFGAHCGQRPIVGGTVCVAHGGRAPQVKRAAAQRIADMVDQALTELLRIAQHGDNEAVRLMAIKDILDRAGLKPKEHIEQTGKLVIEVVYPEAGPI